ncbi:MAG: hypothetical protein R2769_11245 [Saprospiraceae bacterium]
MKKALSVVTVLGILIFSACQSKTIDPKIPGKWAGYQWMVEGNDSGRDVSGVTFSFEENGNYNANYGDQIEKGTYYTENDKLYTKGEGQIEKMVKYQLTGSDTLMIEMNRQGTYEQLYLKRN